MHFPLVASWAHETRCHVGFIYCWSQCQLGAKHEQELIPHVCTMPKCACVDPWGYHHTQPMLTPSPSMIAWDFCPHCSGHTSWLWENFLWDCPIFRQLAFLILIAERVLDPRSSPSHSLLCIAEPCSPDLHHSSPQIPCFSLNTIRCLWAFHEYMSLEWILGSLCDEEEQI